MLLRWVSAGRVPLGSYSAMFLKCFRSQGSLPCLPHYKLQASNSAGKGVEAGSVAQVTCWLRTHQARLLHGLRDMLHHSAYSLCKARGSRDMGNDTHTLPGQHHIPWAAPDPSSTLDSTTSLPWAAPHPSNSPFGSSGGFCASLQGC